MSNLKQKTLSMARTTRAASASAKLAAMFATAAEPDESGGTHTPTAGTSDPVTKNDMEALLNKHCDSFNVAALIQQATESLKQSVDSLRQQVT